VAPDLDTLIALMTLEEKAALCIGKTAWQTTPVERLEIPPLTMSDGPHGVRRVPDEGLPTATSLPATCFPTASALAATWDTALVHQLGQALAEECIALGVDVLLGPGNNMKRTPLCGRNFEYYAEDPCLGGEMAAAFIRGVQSKGVGTSLKHFAANSQEHRRFTVNAQVDERTLREIYLAGFERAVVKGQPWTVMCAYNRLNGTYCSQHRWLLTNLLRDEWGFEGFVVSDWGAVHDRVAALEAGLELEMPGPQADRVQAVVDAVRGGTLDEGLLDRAVERLLSIIFRAAETPKGGETIDVAAHHALARRIAGDAIVLLKNDGDLLPLRDISKLAVIGAAARAPYFQGGGSSHVNPTRVDVPLEELEKAAPDVTLLVAEGDVMAADGVDQALIDEATVLARQADVALLYIALPAAKESEGYDRQDMALTEHQVALIQQVAALQPRTVVVLNNGSAVTMDGWIDRVPAVLEAWMMGQAGGGAIADVLFGRVNPCGRLAETFPYRLEDTPAHINYPGERDTLRYGEGPFIGYRYYDTREQDVLFPFGYGLSYTTFEYANLTVSGEDFRDVDGLEVSLEVINTGDVPGKEVVQLYVADCEATLPRPPKELKGFVKVALEPGETRTVTFRLEPRDFAYYDPAHAAWVRESGEFEIFVAHSAADARLRRTVRMESTQALPSLLHRMSTLGDWLEDARGAAALQPLLQRMMAQAVADPEVPVQGLTLEMLTRMRYLPLPRMLRFASDWLEAGANPEQTVEELLAAVRRKEDVGSGSDGGG
jgi:beta-glucosidase